MSGWRKWLEQLGHPPSAAGALVLAVAAPVLVCALVQWGLRWSWFGLLEFAFAAAVLLIMLGGAWLMTETLRLRSQLTQLQAQNQTERKSLQQQMETERRRNEDGTPGTGFPLLGFDLRQIDTTHFYRLRIGGPTAGLRIHHLESLASSQRLGRFFRRFGCFRGLRGLRTCRQQQDQWQQHTSSCER